MKSLNTYNYHEQLYMKAISYQVSISDDDKIIKIEEDGDLIAELSFALDNNILFLNGKDGLEVAQIELPTSMAAITEQKYDAETKSIDLTILQTNGEAVVFSLDVAELVNVYTAGDGIDITENVISIKIKDASGTLTVDEEGLDIDLDSLASSEDIVNLNKELDELQSETTSLKEYVDNSINIINTNVNDGFVTINEAIANLNLVAQTTVEHLNAETNDRIYGDKILSEHIDNHIAEFVSFQEFVGKEVGALQEEDARLQLMILDEQAAREERDSELNAKINVEMAERIAADESLQNQIGDVAGALEGSIAEEIGKIKEEIGDVKGELEGSIADAIVDLQEQIGDVKGELEGSIADAITDLQEQIGDVKGELEGSIADAIVSLESKDSELNEKIDAEINRATDSENSIKDELSNEIVNREKGDAEIQKQLGDGFANMSVTEQVREIKVAIDNEAQDRIEGDNQALNAISIEREERKAVDEDLKVHIINSREELGNSIKLVKDENNNLKYTLYVDGHVAGEVNIPADKMVESVTYDPETKTLTFTWNTNTPQSPTSIYIGDLVDVYLAGDGLLLNGKTFSINIAQSKYIDINENGSVEFVGVLSKPEGTSWKYDLLDKNGVNNGKFIDFTSDYEAYNQHIQETYAPLTYVDSQDLAVKAELLGVEGDADTTNTIYGLRSAIAKSESVMSAKIAEEQARAEGVETDLGNRIEISKADVAGYVNQEIAKVNETIINNENANSEAHSQISQNVKANSDILASLTNGEQTGVVDKLDRQFHEITKDIDENKFEGLIKSLMDRIAQLEATITILVSGSDVQGSVANVVSNALTEAKLYAQEQSDNAYNNAVAYADGKFQEKGNYITEIDGKYITEDELAEYKFVNEDKLTSTVSNYVLTSVANETYQPKGEYLTSIPTEYITETELETYHYATRDYVDNQDAKLLTKDMADLLYAVTDVNDRYVKTSELISKNYVNSNDLSNAISDMATQSWVTSNFQVKGTYLTSVPSEYVTEGELVAYDFASKAWVHTQLDGIRTDITTISNTKLDITTAANQYQPKGDYVTNSTLESKDYATKTDLLIATRDKVDASYVTNEINKLNINGYVTKTELANYRYVTEDALNSKGYVTLSYLNGIVPTLLTKSEASTTYLTKVAFDEYVKTAFNSESIIAGDNIKVEKYGNSNNVRLSVVLSDGYNVVDTYNQGLPVAKQNLDQVSERLSEAIKKLYDTTDGEIF